MTADVLKKDTTQVDEAKLAEDSQKYVYVRRQIFASTNLIINSLCYGMSFSFTGTLLPSIREYVDAKNETWLAAINVGVILVGSYIGLLMASWFGYKKCLFLSAAMSIIGWISLSYASDFAAFCVGCILVGFSSGMINQMSLTYRVEIPEKELRGIISTIITSCYMLGIFLGHLLTIIFPWRMSMRFCSIIPVISMITLMLIPESPTWLLSKGRKEEARKIFFWLRGKTTSTEDEFDSMQKKQADNEYCVDIKTTLRNMYSRKFFIPLIISSILLTAQCGSGYDVMVVYTEDILVDMSSNLDTAFVTILFDSVSLVFCTLSCIFIRLMTRRTLFFLSSAGTVVALSLLLLVIIYDWSTEVLTLCLCVYTAFVNVGILPVSWLVLTEIFPETKRDIGMCISTGYFSFLTFLLVKLVPVLELQAGIQAALILFLGLVIICSLSLYFIMPETKELSLQEIEDVIRQGKFYKCFQICNCKSQYYIIND